MSRIALAFFTLITLTTHASTAEPKLTAEDAKYLDKIIAGFLFDPTGAERVRGKVTYYTDWGTSGIDTQDGWLVRGKGGKGNRFFFAAGYSEVAPDALVGTDFVAACRARYSTPPKNETPEEASDREERSESVSQENDLTLAAWLHKLGHDDLAAKALAAARKQSANPREQLRFQLAGGLFLAFAALHEKHRDEEAIEFGTRLVKHYPDLIRDEFFICSWQTESILGDLHRRKKAGTFGQGADRVAKDALPTELPRRIAVLIDALDEVIDRPILPAGDTVADDWRVTALVELGEPAIPALLDAFEKDNRRTRTRNHPAVREFVLYAITTILRTEAEELTDEEYLGYPTDRFEKVNSLAAQLRTFWKTYGKYPFDERMMKVLTDPKSSEKQCLDAAFNLAALNTAPSRCWLPELFGNPLLAKFSRPTAAEAILAARDRVMKRAANEEELLLEKLTGANARGNGYLLALEKLGDPRIAPALAKLAEGETNLDVRLRLACVACRLGEPKPMEHLARDFEAGTFNLRPAATMEDINKALAARLLTFRFRDRGNTPSSYDLCYGLHQFAELIHALGSAGLPATDRALFALTDSRHPYYQRTRAGLLGWDEGFSRAHPFWLELARQMLDDTSESGRVYTIKGDRISYTASKGSTSYASWGLPNYLKDSKVRREEATERVCDRIAQEVTDVIPGLPYAHCLFFDNEERLKAVKELLNKYPRRFRALKDDEAEKLGLSSRYYTFFVPDIKPLNRAATLQDVLAGDALFHLDGKGKPVKVALPACVTLTDGSRGLAVQAEVGPDDAIVYGAIFPGKMRTVSAKEVEKVEPAAKK